MLFEYEINEFLVWFRDGFLEENQFPIIGSSPRTSKVTKPNANVPWVQNLQYRTREACHMLFKYGVDEFSVLNLGRFCGIIEGKVTSQCPISQVHRSHLPHRPHLSQSQNLQYLSFGACHMVYMLFAFPAIPPTARMGTNSSELWGEELRNANRKGGSGGKTNVEFAIF